MVFHSGKRKMPPITLATSFGKITKADADYINYSRKQHCEDCLQFISPGTCSKVAGDISMVGTCRLWDGYSTAANLPLGRY